MTELNTNDEKFAPKFESQNVVFWRVVSIVSAGLVLLVALIQSLNAHPLQYRSLLWLAAAAVLVPIAIRFVFPDAWRGLFRNPDLLVPFGIAWFLSEAIGWLGWIPFLGQFLLTGWHGSVFGLSLNASVFTIFNLCIWSAYASWQINLIWQSVRHDRIINISPWPCIRNGFWKALSVLVLGTGVLLLAVIPGMAFGLIGILIIGIVWNLLTVALMPVALSGSQTLLRSLQDGMSASWRLKRYWWLQLAVLLTLLGMITYVVGSYQAEGTFHTSYSFTITAFWAGAFDNEFRWQSKYMAMIKVAPLPLAVAMLKLLFITLAISMKIHVMKRLHADDQIQ